MSSTSKTTSTSSITLRETPSKTRNTTPTKSTTSSPIPLLFTLPTELLDLIYEFTFSDFTVHIGARFCNYGQDRFGYAGWKAVTLHGNPNTGIIATCKQMRAETQRLYYERGVFSFEDAKACDTWLLRSVPPEMYSAIRVLRVPTPWCEDMFEDLEKKRFTYEGSCVARLINDRALYTLREARAEIGQEILGRLSGGVLRAKAVDRMFGVVWTSMPWELGFCMEVSSRA
ncbi:hypothetical protein M409DRAFT_23698 [Zasmidium cellare ATCC 36951]|uniref:Uncharacterized protein n=1 Tax=Zasmidium cellare ATCC 36951 TaxID=1080233 RepID=A0A6A6CFY5_ZASCE|nr:uncharacterized protein M409DRAFT_23698 [Zasmidium cellare ATCC 36951]KAF2165971.1 hypothetical protein M409DRAFT_23698 [Zasmidium cellare ATCC 36951]